MKLASAEVVYWLCPVREDETGSAKQVVEILVGKERVYAFGERTSARKNLKPGDWVCFYAKKCGIVAHARVKTSPEEKPHRRVSHPESYPWKFNLDDVNVYTDNPVRIDSILRAQLDYFTGRNASKWSWLVQTTRRITEHDFRLFTRSESLAFLAPRSTRPL